jgi:hypothetical protein
MKTTRVNRFTNKQLAVALDAFEYYLNTFGKTDQTQPINSLITQIKLEQSARRESP